MDSGPIQLPDAEALRTTAAKVVQGPDYNLRDDNAIYNWIASQIQRLLAPLQNLFNSIYEVSPVLAWLIIGVLFLILVALIIHIVYSFRSALSDAPGFSPATKLSKQQDDPAVWTARARDAAAREDYITAVRSLFLASLLALEQSQKRSLRRGSTNREYLRRYKDSPAHEPLSLFVQIIDFKWYGGGNCGADDYQNAYAAYERIQRFTRGTL